MIRAMTLSLALAAPAAAQEGAISTVDIGELPTAETPIAGVESAFVVGDFTGDGLYAAKAIMREGSVFPAHTHPDDRLTLVLDGTMYLGEGDTYDEASLVAYPAGVAAVTPAGTAHFMAAPDGDVTVLEIGAGPSASRFTEGG